MKRQPAGQQIVYYALLAGAFAAAVLTQSTIGAQGDHYAYDWMYRRYRPPAWRPDSVILAIDEQSLNQYRGMSNIRGPLAEGLKRVGLAHPRAVAVDIILASASDKATDESMRKALRSVPNLVLDSELIGEPHHRQWEDPLPAFRDQAAALGHVHADPDSDWVARAIPLYRLSDPAPGTGLKVRRWALALEAYRLSRGESLAQETGDLRSGRTLGLRVGGTLIPVPDNPNPGLRDGRLMRIRYMPPGAATPIPRVSLKRLLDDPTVQTQFAGKVVFVGVTAQTEVKDRLATPYSGYAQLAGVEVHANAFETLNTGQFITDAGTDVEWLFAFLLVAAAGAVFLFLRGWLAYAAGAAVLVVAHVTPYVFFTHNRVLSFVLPASAAWLSALVAGCWQALVVRRSLRVSEEGRLRYQQAMHFVTHEMRTPLSAIQGSSELISRYALTEEKRKQIAELINSESKRLARMIEVFLNVEKLSAGQMEMKKESVSVKDLVDICILRTQPLAERKHIEIVLKPVAPVLQLTGDRELMEYACYNLLTNAVKYSPQHTEVTVSGWRDKGQVLIAIDDHGIGMNQKEVKRIFQKFYRTKKAEQSGEAGTGIGLSIVKQIVEQHGGRIDVVSRPGQGSRFTLVLPAAARSKEPTAVERH
jgi:signal transduction histidine kinase